MSSLPHNLKPPDASGTVTLEEPRCPACDQPIAGEQVARVRERFDAVLSRERKALEASAAKEIADFKEAATARLAAMEEKHEAEVRTAREEATKAANAVNAAGLLVATQKRKAAEEELEALRANQDTVLNQRLAELREVLDEEKLKAVNLTKAAAFEEKQKIEEKLAAAQRELQRKTSTDLGEGAEIDLFDALKEEFPQDVIKRVKKGEPGADIIHDVMEKGKTCGRIVYDSKNRNAWRNDYVEKLRTDQIAANADHAILTTHAFPAGTRQLHVQDGVIVANPARAVMVATVLRQHVVQISALRISNDARDEKVVQLYEFVTSEQFAQRLGQIETLAQDLLDLDVKEQTAHSNTWNKRGKIIRSVQRARGDLSSEIDRIIGNTDSSIEAVG